MQSVSENWRIVQFSIRSMNLSCHLHFLCSKHIVRPSCNARLFENGPSKYSRTIISTKNTSNVLVKITATLGPAPGEFVFSRHSVSHYFSTNVLRTRQIFLQRPRLIFLLRPILFINVCMHGATKSSRLIVIQAVCPAKENAKWKTVFEEWKTSESQYEFSIEHRSVES